MRGVNGASWNNKRPDGVTLSFQRCGNLVETKFNMSSNILGNDPSRPDLSYKTMHFRPEVSLIRRPTPFSGNAEGLAGIAPADKVDVSSIVCSIQLADVGMDGDSRPMLSEDGAAEGIDFTEGDGSEARLFEAKTEPSDAGEKVEDIHDRLSVPCRS